MVIHPETKDLIPLAAVVIALLNVAFGPNLFFRAKAWLEKHFRRPKVARTGKKLRRKKS